MSIKWLAAFDMMSNSMLVNDFKHEILLLALLSNPWGNTCLLSINCVFDTLFWSVQPYLFYSMRFHHCICCCVGEYFFRLCDEIGKWRVWIWASSRPISEPKNIWNATTLPPILPPVAYFVALAAITCTLYIHVYFDTSTSPTALWQSGSKWHKLSFSYIYSIVKYSQRKCNGSR